MTGNTKNQGKLLIYTGKKGGVELRADAEKETIWASLEQIAELFGRDKSVISRHIKNIYLEKKLSENATVAKNATVQKEGDREVMRMIEYYNLDAIISIGYRVNSKQATQFRIWATKTLREYLVKGFVIFPLRLLPSVERYLDATKWRKENQRQYLGCFGITHC